MMKVMNYQEYSKKLTELRKELCGEINAMIKADTKEEGLKHCTRQKEIAHKIVELKERYKNDHR